MWACTMGIPLLYGLTESGPAMINFFEQQARARRKTRVLVLLMVLSVFCLALAVYALIMLVLTRDPTAVVSHWNGQIFFSCLWTTAVIVVLSSTTRTVSLREGGAGIAEMLGGRLVSGNARDVLEKRLLNIVEEMAIASGIAVPRAFVLGEEQGINAFAAGFTPADAVIVVTRGCLEKLSRDELQGVVAHEFSHVLNGDMLLNLRLMGIVYGIVSIALAGRLMMRVAGQSRLEYAEDDGTGDKSAGGIVFVVGAGVFLIGLLGEVFGKLIRAAVSRQREFLADASAVQFTRNPEGLAGALKKIGGFWAGAGVSADHAEEVSHFFFSDIHKPSFWNGLFATHPPLAERVRLIDPSFRGEFPEVAAGIAEPDDLPIAALVGAPRSVARASSMAPSSAAHAVVSRVGTTNVRAAAAGKRSLEALPMALRDAAESPFSACGIVYALLLSEDTQVCTEQLAQVQARCGAALRVEAQRMTAHVRGIARRERFSLLLLLAPGLRALSRAQRTAFIRTVQAIIEADAAVSIFEYVVGQSLRMRFDDNSPARKRVRVRYRRLAEVRAELELLMSLLAHTGAFDAAEASSAFTAGTARLPGVKLTLLAASPRLLSGLGAALENLIALPPQLSAQVVDACAHCVLADERVADDEELLLHAVCEALRSPIPLLT